MPKRASRPTPRSARPSSRRDELSGQVPGACTGTMVLIRAAGLGGKRGAGRGRSSATRSVFAGFGSGIPCDAPSEALRDYRTITSPLCDRRMTATRALRNLGVIPNDPGSAAHSELQPMFRPGSGMALPRQTTIMWYYSCPPACPSTACPATAADGRPGRRSPPRATPAPGTAATCRIAHPQLPDRPHGLRSVTEVLRIRPPAL